jgi:hypothetical protein
MSTELPAQEALGNITVSNCYLPSSAPCRKSPGNIRQDNEQHANFPASTRHSTDHTAPGVETAESPACDLIGTNALSTVPYKTYSSPINSDTYVWDYGSTLGEFHSGDPRDSASPVGTSEQAQYSRATRTNSTFELWHARLGHLNYDLLREIISKNLIAGIPSIKPGSNKSNAHCRACALAKSTRQPIPKIATHLATRPLECIHIDVLDIRDVGRNDERYAILITDEFTSFLVGKPMTAKSEAFSAFKEYHQRAYAVQRHLLLSIQLDCGELATLREFQEHCTTHGIAVRISETDTPQQNGAC